MAAASAVSPWRWRRRAIAALVFEAAPELRPVGKGIWVPTNAMQVFQRLGLDEKIRAAGWELEQIQSAAWPPMACCKTSICAPCAGALGHSTVSIHRAALVAALAGDLPTDTLCLGKRCTGFDEGPDGVTVPFDDGSSAQATSWSVPMASTRSSASGSFPACRCVMAAKPVTAASPRWSCRPTSHARAGRYGAGNFGLGFPPSEAGRSTGSRRSRRFQQPGDARAPVRRAGGPLWTLSRADLRNLSPDAIDGDHSGRSERFRPIRSWSKGRVVLLGDAAHAMTPNLGQGERRAIEDAFVLSEQIARQPEPSIAFREYESIRMPKVRWIVDTASRLGQIATGVRGRHASCATG